MPLVSRDGRSETVQAAKSAELQVNLLQAKTRQDLEAAGREDLARGGAGAGGVPSLSSTQALAEENVLLRDKAFGQGSLPPSTWWMPATSWPGSRPSAPPLINT
jgi:hypothetical protein